MKAYSATTMFIMLFCLSAFADHAKTKSIMKESPALLKKLQNLKSKLVYETYCNGNWELFTLNPTGGSPENLSKTPNAHEMYPQVSPDGRKICFVVDEEHAEGKRRCVYFMRMDGSGRKKIGEGCRQPCWGPDSKTIAFVKSKYPKYQPADYATKGLYFYNIDTGKTDEHQNKSIHHLYNLCWSKNGKWIVATVHAGMGYKHTNLAVRVDGVEVYDLKIGGCRPDLSADGQMIAWGRTDFIIGVADIDLESDIPVVSNIRNLVVDNVHVYHIEWAPGGDYLCYSRGPGGRVIANGSGTNTGLSEMVGMCGTWNLCVTPLDGERIYTTLTQGQGTSKEVDWHILAK
jgi:Tol biopolymer transport system component